MKKRGTTFCGKLDVELPLPVRSFKEPPYTLKNYLLGFRRIARVNNLVQIKRISAIRWKIGIPAQKRQCNCEISLGAVLTNTVI